MKVFAPNYYEKFHCIADKCNHSCCIGWEIDIDDATLAQYKKIKTNFGKKLNDSIVFNDDCAYFKLTSNERCPFLNKDNLCEIILNLGENALCQICSDHPRFRNYYGDRVEIGLGLTCEEVARIIINEAECFELVEIDEMDETPTIYEDEIQFFELRNEIFKIINNENNFDYIIEKLLNKFSIKFPYKTIFEWVEIYSNLEMLDNNWGNFLNDLKSNENSSFLPNHSNNNALKNLLIYFIYRHLGESIYDGNFNGRLLFAIISCYMILALCKIGYSIEDVARMYSSEIEYSDENLNKLIDLMQSKSLEV